MASMGFVTFRASCTAGVILRYPFVRYGMPRRETTIERIFREVMGRKMPPSVKRILLRKRKAKSNRK